MSELSKKMQAIIPKLTVKKLYGIDEAIKTLKGLASLPRV